MLSLLLLSACSEAPMLKGRVVDLWNQPIEGATVSVAGEKPLTDEYGVYSLKPLDVGEHSFMVGRKGYVQDDAVFTMEEGTTVGPTFKLYKKPEDKGFYAVTVGDYRQIEASTVQVIGHAGDSTYGIQPPSGRIFVEGEDLKIVYKIDLTLPQIKSLGLKLHQMDFVESTTMQTVAGGEETQVPINLFVTKKTIPLTIEALKSKGHFVIGSPDKLEAGKVYALESQGLLAPDDAQAWSRIPASLRNVYPFTVK